MIEDMGGRILALCPAMGSHDAVVVFEAPDDETAAPFPPRVGTPGHVRTTAMRAFGEDEFRRLAVRLP